MKRFIVFGLVFSIGILGCHMKENQNTLVNEFHIEIEEIDLSKINEEKIIRLVEDFGNKLKNVFLLSHIDELEKSMIENYSEYVVYELLDKWLDEPENAPGRLVSSPWPDRIEVFNINEVSETEYEVKGQIIEVTSNIDERYITRPIIISIKNIGDKWLIYDIVLDQNE